MVRITFAEDDEKLTLKLEGRLMGARVHEVWQLVRQTELQNRRFEVDIHDLAFVDGEGEQTLLWLYRMGAHFLGGSEFSDCLCKTLGIPVSER